MTITKQQDKNSDEKRPAGRRYPASRKNLRSKMHGKNIWSTPAVVLLILLCCLGTGCTTMTSVKAGDFGSQGSPAGGALVSDTLPDNTRVLITETRTTAAPETTTLIPVIVSAGPSRVTVTPTTLTPTPTRTQDYPAIVPSLPIVTTPTMVTPTPTTAIITTQPVITTSPVITTTTTITTTPTSTTPTIPSCPSGQTTCNGTCVDLQTSVSNCGACGNLCGEHRWGNTVCIQGVCDYTCSSGWVKYNGGCSMPPN